MHEKGTEDDAAEVQKDPDRASDDGIDGTKYRLRAEMIWRNVEHITVAISVQGDVDELCEDDGDAEDRECTPESPTGSVRKSSGTNIERRQQHHDMPDEAMSRQQRMSRMQEAFMYDQCQCTAEKAVVLQKGQEGPFEDEGTPPCTLPQHTIKEGEVHRE